MAAARGQLGFMVYRGFDNEPDFFCGWHFTGYSNATKGEHIPKWKSQNEPPHNTGEMCQPVLFRSESDAITAGKEIIEKTDNKRVEVMQILGGYIRFDLKEVP